MRHCLKSFQYLNKNILEKIYILEIHHESDLYPKFISLFEYSELFEHSGDVFEDEKGSPSNTEAAHLARS